jgi:hypothetical protein
MVLGLLLAACTAPTSTPGPTPLAAPATVLPASVTPTPFAPTITASPSLAPTQTPTATPIPVTVYNRYVGRDTTRQPELFKTSPPVSPIRSAEGYSRSYIEIFLSGKQVNGDEIRGDPQMLAHLILLFNDAFKAQHTAQTVLSSYRSYDEQLYLRQTGGEDNDNAIAPPGRSEHHLGTAVDLAWQAERLNFYLMNVYPRARQFYNWLKENAQRYGFIFSYPYKTTPDGKKDNLLEPYLTEYKAEPWHLRYVGLDLAQKIYNARDDQGRNYLDPLSPLIPQQFMLP